VNKSGSIKHNFKASSGKQPMRYRIWDNHSF